MSIQNHSRALFTSTSCIAINTGHGNGEEEFLLLLVVAVIDVQWAEKKDEVEPKGNHGTHVTALAIHTRPSTSILQLQHNREGNTESQAQAHEVRA